MSDRTSLDRVQVIALPDEDGVLKLVCEQRLLAPKNCPPTMIALMKKVGVLDYKVTPICIAGWGEA